MSFDRIASQARVVLCAGTGGVGKTTVAAALGVRAAAEGRRVAVITVDPAQRLADAVGISLSNQPKLIEGPWSGELWAMMLDAKQTFDDVVVREAESPERAAQILDNRLYQNVSGVLSGTQEFMANEKLFELHESGRFDLIVVDTPPTRNALDFLDSPDKLLNFLDGLLMRLLFPRRVRKVVNAGLRLMLRQVSAVIGSRIVADAEAFLRAFQGMEDGFRDRARQTKLLLADSDTAVVMVTTPRFETADETRWFVDEVVRRGLRIGGLVVNRVHPSFTDVAVADLGAACASQAGDALGPACAVLIKAQTRVESERSAIDELAGLVAPASVTEVPLLHQDVRDLAGIQAIASHLT